MRRLNATPGLCQLTAFWPTCTINFISSTLITRRRGSPSLTPRCKTRCDCNRMPAKYISLWRVITTGASSLMLVRVLKLRLPDAHFLTTRRYSSCSLTLIAGRDAGKNAFEMFERSIELDPRNYFITQQAALTFKCVRDYSKMAAALDRALEIVPNDVNTIAARGIVDL